MLSVLLLLCQELAQNKDLHDHEDDDYHIEQDHNYQKEKVNKNTLIIAGPKEVPENIEPIYVINDNLNKPIFKIYDTNNI